MSPCISKLLAGLMKLITEVPELSVRPGDLNIQQELLEPEILITDEPMSNDLGVVSNE